MKAKIIIAGAALASVTTGCSMVGAERLATREGQGIFTLSADAEGLRAWGENWIGSQAAARDDRNAPVEYFETRKQSNALRFKARVVKSEKAS